MDREIKENAIVLKAEDSGDYDRILTMLSISRGLIKAKIKGVKKPKAKLSFASFPFAFGEYIFVKSGNSFNTVINCNFVDSFIDLTYDLNKFYAGSAILEITRLIAKENQACTGLFVSLLKVLQDLAYTNKNMLSLLTKYLLDCLEFTGLAINIDVNLKLNEQAYFNYDFGLVSNNKTEDSIVLNENDVNSLALLLSGDESIIDESVKTSKNLLKLITNYFETKIDERFEVLEKFCK